MVRHMPRRQQIVLARHRDVTVSVPGAGVFVLFSRVLVIKPKTLMPVCRALYGLNEFFSLLFGLLILEKVK